MLRLANALEGNNSKDGWGGVPYVRIDGETDSRDRRTACLQFKEDPSIRVALLSITAAGMLYCLAMHCQMHPVCQVGWPHHYITYTRYT